MARGSVFIFTPSAEGGGVCVTFWGCGVVLIKIYVAVWSVSELLLAAEQVEHHLFVAAQSRQDCMR